MKKTTFATIISAVLLAAIATYAGPTSWEYWDWDGGSANTTPPIGTGNTFNTAGNWQTTAGVSGSTGNLPGADYSCYFKTRGYGALPIRFSGDFAVGNFTIGSANPTSWSFDGPTTGGPWTLTLNTDSGHSDPNYYLWNADTAGRTLTIGGTDAARLELNLAAGDTKTIKAAGAIIINCVMKGNGFTKTLGSTLTLGGAGANTYSGTTTLTEGTLILSKSVANGAVPGNLTINGGTVQLNAWDQIADGATVSISGAGVMNMNGQSDTVGALNLDGVAKAAGTWGAAGSGATHTSSHFSGSGILTVSTGPTPTIGFADIAAVCAGSLSSLSATVSGGNSPSGNVEFISNVAGSLGTAPLVSGVATKLVALSTTTHSITAKYLGDDNNNEVTSAAKNAIVNAPPTAPDSGAGNVS